MNKEQFTRFVTKEYSKLRAYIRNRMYAIEEAEPEDILQEVLLRLYDTPDVSSVLDNLAGYVYRSLRNKIIDTLRKKKRTLSLDENFASPQDNPGLGDILQDLRYDMQSEVERQELKQELYQALSLLEEKDRVLIIAHEFEQKTFQELADEWQIPLGTLLARKARAMKKLKHLMERHFN